MADADRLAHVEQQVDGVVKAQHEPGDRRRVKVSGPMPSRLHMERRLHQLIYEDGDYETGPPPPPANDDRFADANLEARRDNLEESGYTVVNIQSRDRSKLLFDTACTMTDMKYVVYHATVESRGPLAVQVELHHNPHVAALLLDLVLLVPFDSGILRPEHGRVHSGCGERELKGQPVLGGRCGALDISTRDRRGLLSDITRVLRENGLSLTRAECVTRWERTVGTFYVTDASGGGNVGPKRMEAVREELIESVTLVVRAGGWGCAKSNYSRSSSTTLSSSLSTPMEFTAYDSASGSKSTTATLFAFNHQLLDASPLMKNENYKYRRCTQETTVHRYSLLIATIVVKLSRLDQPKQQQ
ncbi:hypothetical protein BHE74_00041253 [Ensete ventricosum]|nr:hypothetical protein BHE74_00041253 [Ensete ventricosum]